MEKYYNEDGQVAVLVSPGYGAGWSTLAYDNEEFFVMDKGLVELAMNDAEERDVIEYIVSKGISPPFMHGWYQVEVVFVEKDTRFRIREYDGDESIETLEDVNWMVA